MGCIAWPDRIEISPDLHHGDPCIRGTRIPVAIIVGSLADGMTPREIREAYPQLTVEDIQAALAYAADLVYHWPTFCSPPSGRGGDGRPAVDATLACAPSIAIAKGRGLRAGRR